MQFVDNSCFSRRLSIILTLFIKKYVCYIKKESTHDGYWYEILQSDNISRMRRTYSMCRRLSLRSIHRLLAMQSDVEQFLFSCSAIVYVFPWLWVESVISTPIPARLLPSVLTSPSSTPSQSVPVSFRRTSYV